MLDLISFIALLFGSLLLLIGLVMIANQVRLHQIRIYSAASWVYRIGAFLSALGLLIMLLGDGLSELATLGLVTGGAGLLGALFTLNHERAQALHNGASRWNWPGSLTVQIAGLAALQIVLALIR